MALVFFWRLFHNNLMCILKYTQHKIQYFCIIKIISYFEYVIKLTVRINFVNPPNELDVLYTEG